MLTLRIIGLCLVSAIACSPKDPEDTATTGGSTGSPGTGSTGSSGETPTTGGPTTTGVPDGTSGSVSATGDSSSSSDGTSTSGDPTTSAGTDPSETGTSTGDSETGVMLACDAGGSNLEGVCIVFPPQKISFTLAEAKAGVEFAYTVVVTADVPGVVSQPLETCDEPTAAGLFLLERVEGAGQAYCVCDSGLCMDPVDVPFTLKVGEYPASFAWDGVNWNGPSDTGNPKGPPFPPGMYTVQVVTQGTHDGVPYEVIGELPITLTQ